MSGSSSKSGLHTLQKLRKDAWVPNAMASSCYGCGSEFTLTRRIHHCRLCGGCYCGACSSKRLQYSKAAAAAAKAKAQARGKDARASVSDEVEGGDAPSSASASGKMGALFKRTLNRAAQGIAALSGPVKPIRVCDTCFETEALLAAPSGGGGGGIGGAGVRAQGAGADPMHLDSDGSSGEGSSDDDGAVVWAAGASEASRMAVPPPAPASSAAAPAALRKGNLPMVADSDDDDDDDASASAPAGSPAAMRGRLERTARKIRLDVPGQSAPPAAGAEASASSSAAPGAGSGFGSGPAPPPPPPPSAAPSPAAAHSHALCVFNRFFRVGARESVKLVIPDPVLMYLGNKKHVVDFTGLGDGGLFGPGAGSGGNGGMGSGAGASSSSASGSGSGSGMGAVWSHLRSVVHSHPCSHSAANHSPTTPASGHIDCGVPHISSCAEAFPFRYGSLVITNYQIIFVPMLVPPPVGSGGRGHAGAPEPFRASDSCTQCRDAPPDAGAGAAATPARATGAAAATTAPVTTSTCCSQCGCMPLLNEWEHIANNSVACRTQIAPHLSLSDCSSPAGADVPSQHTCLPIMPLSIPLLSLSRFRLRTFDRADLGELDLRSKGFVVTRFLLPGLVTRNRVAAFRNVAVALDWFSKVHKHEAAAAAAAAAASLASQQHAAAAQSHGEKRLGLLSGNSSINSVELDVVSSGGGGSGGSSHGHGHGQVEEHEGAGALRKICFAFRWDRERDAHPHHLHQRAHHAKHAHAASHSHSHSSSHSSSSRSHAAAAASGQRHNHKAHHHSTASLSATGGDSDAPALQPDELLSSEEDEPEADVSSGPAAAVQAPESKNASSSSSLTSGLVRSRRAAMQAERGPSGSSYSAAHSLTGGGGGGGGGGGNSSDEDGVEWAPRALTGVEGGGALAAHEAAQEAQSLASALAAKHARFVSAWAPDPVAPLSSPSPAPAHVLLDGWALYNPLAEYGRLGLLDFESHYRLTTINVDYTFSRTYPALLVVPRAVGDRDLEALAPFRSKARIPAVVWARRNVTHPIARHAEGSPAAARAASSAQNRPGARGARLGGGGGVGGAAASVNGAVDSLLAVANPEVVMLRSSQPMVGLTRGRNAADELFLQAVVACSPSHRRLVVADARPLANAMAQQVNGKGTELVENYASHSLRDVTISFLNIGNIHVMREAEEALLKVCQHAAENKFINATGAVAEVAERCSQTRGCGAINRHCPEIAADANSDGGSDAACASTPTSAASIASALATARCPSACTCSCCSVHVGGQHGLGESASSWWSSLLATGHFEHLGAILRGANFIASTIAGGTSVLVHCSDGWDRTSQLTSLAQLLLDPFYRTVRGFFVLIAKEWLSFGHKFTERVGHGGIGGTENSPVFSQWLDCVWQVLSQHASRFEFHQGLLLALRHSLHSGKYGDWMGNCEAERNAFVAAASSSSSSSSAAAGAGAGAGPAHSGSSATGGGGGSSWRLRDKTPSIFTQLWSYRAAFLNPSYEHAPGGTPFLDAQSPHVRAHPLQVDLARLAFWGEYYMGTAAPATKFSGGGAAVQARTASGQTKPMAQTQAQVPAAATATTAAAEVESLLESERAAAQAAQTRALAEQKEAYESRLAAQSRALDEALAALSAFKAAQIAAAATASAAGVMEAGAGGTDNDHPPPPPPFRPSMLEQEPRAAHSPPVSVVTVAAAGPSAPAPSSSLDGAIGEADTGADADADGDAVPAELDDAADLDVDGLDLDATRPRALGRTSTMLRPRHGRADAVAGAQVSASPRSFPAATAAAAAAARALSPVHAAGSPPAASNSLTATASPASSAGAMGKLRKEGPALPAKLRAVPPPPPPEENERRDSELDPPPPPPPVPDDRSASRSSLPPPPPPPLPSSPPSMAILRPAPIALTRAAAEPAAEPEANAGSSPARAL